MLFTRHYTSVNRRSVLMNLPSDVRPIPLVKFVKQLALSLKRPSTASNTVC